VHAPDERRNLGEVTTHRLLYRRSLLLASGLTSPEVQRLVARGDLVRVRRGAYIEDRITDPRAVHRIQAIAAAHDLASGAVLSHVSAAVVHGLPIWALDLDRVTVTRSRRSGGRVDPRLHTYTATITPPEVDSVEGVAVTSVARTVVDLARIASFESSVVLTDSALGGGLVTQDDLAAALARATRWPGVPKARRVVAFADERAESVGESRSRIAIHRAGLPAPVPQWPIYETRGLLIARSDFGWPEHGLVGEFDGRVKYDGLLRPGQTPADAVFEEKRREDAIRATGLMVVRWTWDEIPSFTAKLRHFLP
jgi:hypothetical protein